MGFSTLRVLWLIALRNIYSHKLKSAIVGTILLFGTFLVVVGTALLDSIVDSMEQSITASMAGQLQIYDKSGPDKLSLFGQIGTSDQDVGELDRFGEIRKALEAHDNVEAVVPMGIGVALALTGNTIDQTLDAMRKARREGDKAELDLRRRQIVRIASVVDDQLDRQAVISSNDKKIEDGRVLLERIKAPDFWNDLGSNFETKMQLLETQLAPLSPDGRIFWVRYIGTDTELFRKHFSRFKVIKGEMIPEGARGLMLSKRLYERWVKNKVARDFDDIREQVQKEGRSIDNDELLQQQVDRMARQYGRILLKLSPDDADALEADLRKLLPEVQGDLGALLHAFLKVDDGNLEQRYAQFYSIVGPRMRIYDLEIGDVVTLRAVSRRGYVRAVNVKIYGVFAFEGLEDSDMAGVANLLDIMTFRDIYGKMTDAQREELKDLREEVGIDDLERNSAEDALFGDGSVEIEEVDGAEGFDEFSGVEFVGSNQRLEDLETSRYNAIDVDKGFVLNAAIVLKDPARLEESRRAIQKISQDQGLGLAVLDWQEASGLVGQFVLVVQVVLYTMIFIIFLVALVILNNAMVMATLERTGEIGTMRAIGAQRRFVLWMFLLETIALGLLSGALGSLLGVATIELLAQVGLPASNDALKFVFGGEALFPFWSWRHIVVAMAIILVVSVISTIYPARVATRIQPVVAMQTKE